MLSDVVVVGGGVAGWVATRRAQQLGLGVTLLEKGPRPTGDGNTTLSGGQFHAAYRTPFQEPQVIAERLLASTDGHSRPDVVAAWSQNVLRAFQYLKSEGGDFGPLDTAPDGYERFILQPDFGGISLCQPEERHEGSGPWLLLTKMSDAFVKAGGTLKVNPRASGLIQDHAGAITGVEVALADGTHEKLDAGAVVIADGGFQANAKLVAQYITPYYALRGGSGDTGDGLTMGLAAGAAIVNMRPFYGHCVVRDSVDNPRLWPLPNPEAIVRVAMVVDGSGKRIVDENLGNHAVAAAIAANETPDRCWAIFTGKVWEEEGRLGLHPSNPVLLDEGATVVRASSVADLARTIEVDRESLEQSVRAFNAYAESGQPIHPERTDRAVPLHGPELVALPVVAGITFTMGGLLVNGQAQVLSKEDESPIAGLYAAGGSMGGLQGGPNSGYSGGWSEASTFGLLAPETIQRMKTEARSSVIRVRNQFVFGISASGRIDISF